MKKKLIILLFITIFSVLKAEAFLGKDLWFNLYNEIDKWFYKLQQSQLNYELKWWDKIWNLTKNLNKYLIDNWDKWCIKNMSIKDLNEIINKQDIKKLYNHIDDKCKNNNWVSVYSMWKYMSFLENFKIKAENRAKEKSKNIYEISKLWLYTDWSTKNSPFDLIKDLQEIDKIIFWEEIEYNWENNSDFLNNFENNPFLKENSKNNLKNNNKIGNLNNNWNNNLVNDKDNNKDNNKNNNKNENNNLENLLDWNNYICPEDNDKSWLDSTELDNLKNDLNNLKNAYQYNFNTWENWHLKLPDSNQIWNLNNNSWITINSSIIWSKPYSLVNDNSQWNCSPENFFCITIDFIVHQQKWLWYWKEKSILNLIEVSNWHLKKAVNTSLLQAKMWTNNFENILRDLDFSEMFHMGIIISSKSPPILNLETQKEKYPDKDKADSKYKKILETLYKNQGLEFNRKNDLNKIAKKEEKLIELINSAENSLTIIWKREKQRNIFLSNFKAENEFLNNYKINLINKWILEDFYQELVEYEKFIWWLHSYTNNILSYIKIMYEKPRWD